MKKAISCLLSVLILSNILYGCNQSNNKNNSKAKSISSEFEYEDMLFNSTRIHEINIEISQDDWDDLIENPINKTKYSTNITIDGNTVDNVSFSTKGNTSLSSVAGSDSDRYSFKINFGKYVEGQTYYGLDKMHLQNIYADATYMKDYISYRIMAGSSVASPLCSYVVLSINGKEFGLYLAVEDISESFLKRNYGDDYGELYKPETTQLANADGGGMNKDKFTPNMKEMPSNGGTIPDNGEIPSNDGTIPDNGEMPSNGGTIPDNGEMPSNDGTIPNNGEMPSNDRTIPDNGEMPSNGGIMPGGGFSDSSAGADLAYIDDNVESYSDIFNNAETNPDNEDKQRLIKSLQNLSTGENLNQCINIEEVLRYFVAHNFTVNGDSYTGSMLHNYFLYEEEGLMNMLPWDYNLAFGAFSQNGNKNGSSINDATSAVNSPMDSLLTSDDSSRPMWTQIMNNEEYVSEYHQYYSELLNNYFASGDFENEIDSIYSLIRPYVEKDPTAWYTVDEFDTAVTTLKQFCLLRAESLQGQLDGTIPSTSSDQNNDSSSLIDASDISISTMGQMHQEFDKNPNTQNPNVSNMPSETKVSN